MANQALVLTPGASGLLNEVVLLLPLPFRGRKLFFGGLDLRHNQKHPDSRMSPEMGVGASTSVCFAVKCSSRVCSSTTTRAATKEPVDPGVLPTMESVDQAVAARRAMAIGRVAQDDDRDTKRGYGLFSTKRKDTIFTQSWTPVSVKVRWGLHRTC